MTYRIIQAYKQAPWRVQIQWIGLFLLGLILVAGVASIYLNVSANAAATGRKIQSLDDDGDTLKRNIADLETKLAYLTSASVMESRAVEMGFAPVPAESPLYVVVPDYPGRQPAVMAPPPGPGMIVQPILRPAYTESLWEWLFQGFVEPLSKTEQAQP
ncbi:MAG TPA: hypothetical protein VHO48_15730 [Anaerolineaceae bacterium]|nr:hypothetical protein [Anaerolineaceae bacterium]